MTQLQDTDKTLSPVYKRRVSSKVRKALNTRLRHRLPWAECAERAGITEAAIHKARKQPHVQALWEQLKAQYIKDAEALEPVLKAHALHVAGELLDQKESLPTRARMVEFLRREPPSGPSVAVQINTGGAGYEFRRPGAQVVEIRDPTDATSEGQDEESQQ